MSIHRTLSVLFIGVLSVAQVQPLIGRQAPPVAAGQASAEEERAARGRFNIGSRLLISHDYQGAMVDFEYIVTNYKNTTLVDDARLAMATYYLEVVNNLDEAENQANLLIQLKNHNREPNGHLILGRVALARGRTPEYLRSALASYGRVPEVFPGHNEAVAEALYRAGDAYRLDGRPNEAIDSFRKVCADYPQSPWCVQASMGMALGLVRTGRWQQAMERLQWVRANFPSESERAYQWNTILFRLYVKQARLFTVSTAQQIPIKDVQAMVVDPAGRLLLAGKGGVRIFVEGKERSHFCSTDCGVVFLGQRGRPFAIRAGVLMSEQSSPKALEILKDGGKRPIGDISAAAAFSTGEVLVAAKDSGLLHRFSAEGNPLGPFQAQVRARRLAVSELDEVAVLERDSKTISTWRRSDGTLISRFPVETMRDPVDIAFDPLGHLYVLDRDSGSVWIINAFERTVGKARSFSIPERTDGAFQEARAFALDAFGRLMIFDEKTERVRIYQ